METLQSNSLLLAVVLLAHAAVLGATVIWKQESRLPDTLPTISGVLIDAPPANVVQAPAAASQPPEPEPIEKPKPEPKPKPKPKPLEKPKPQPVPQPQPQPQPEKAITPPPEPSPEPVASESPPPPKATSVAKATDSSTEGAPVTVPRVDANHRNNPAPAYPRLSRRRGEEGTVLLELMVRKDGTVNEVTIKESSGYPRLDKSAMEAVRRWKYNPATRGGEPIDYRYLQPVTFSLKG